MGAFQSKLWSEANSELPGSPSESQPLSNNGKPIAPFRDPRSISDDVERTPIQIAAAKAKISVKTNDGEKENRPAVDQTPTGPSLAQRFKASSIDPRSPGGQGLTRTPIILKDQADNETLKEKDNQDCKGIKQEAKPIRGTAAFVNKLIESAEIEELLEDTGKMEITEKGENPLTSSAALPKENNKAEMKIDQLENSSELPEESLRPASQGSSGPEDMLSPSNNRCGKKTLFPMVFGYQEAKSPRSPLGTVNLNTHFMPSSSSEAEHLKAGGDCRKESMNKVLNLKIKRIPMDKEAIENLLDQENENDENQSLVI